MPLPDDPRPQDTVLGAIRLKKNQQLHLRRRVVGDLPVMLEFSKYNAESGKYGLTTPFEDDPRVIKNLISLLQHHLDTGYPDV